MKVGKLVLLSMFEEVIEIVNQIHKIKSNHQVTYLIYFAM